MRQFGFVWYLGCKAELFWEEGEAEPEPKCVKRGVVVKFKVVSNKRISIYLTKREVEEEKINIPALYQNPKKLKEQLAHVFLMARSETGFAAEESDLEIEMIPIVDGDLLISLSKREGKERLRAYIGGQTQVYYFDDIEDLITCAAELEPHFSGTSSLYRMEEKYYLILYPHRIRMDKLLDLKSVLGEFGQTEGEDGPSAVYLKEHGQLLCKRNAVQTIVAAFVKPAPGKADREINP